ncbi:SDR family NAD(P)-dependent oxidoreductase [Microbacterium phyllosphaerae]|uniref:SDR family NAD(P)-dependent oxidoreductase n=1 Tax=Microbacterium phyllosphaerae TaxID=124798 RepID=UPI003D65022B
MAENSVAPSGETAWVITGPTSGIGYRTALELAAHGTVILVGRNADKLSVVEKTITENGGHATSIVADMSDIVSVRRAASEILGLGLRIGGVLNNAGAMPATSTLTPHGWDSTFATNHLGPLAFTDALVSSLPDRANVVFICSSTEDPTDKAATRSGFRGSRYISAEASSRGEYEPGGSTQAGADAYATSKQGNLATVLSMARQVPRLRFRAVEPGFNPGSSLSRDLPLGLRIMTKALMPFAAFIPGLNTPRRAARTIVRVLTDQSPATGVYYDGTGRTMSGSERVRDLRFSDRYLAESRALLATIPQTGPTWPQDEPI